MIAQVENSRPPSTHWLTPADSYLHPDVQTQTAIYRESNAPPRLGLPDSNGDNNHALRVAGVMVGTGRHKGVAPGALLHAAATGVGYWWQNQEAIDLLTGQKVARDRSPKAINYSFGLDNIAADGNSLVSRGLDWIATRFDLSNVVAAENQPDRGPGRTAAPSDIYNGIVVGAADVMPDGDTSMFRKFGQTNMHDPSVSRDTRHNRSLIEILAPASAWMPTLTGSGQPTYENRAGVSYAAPHVTGAIALLQEYGSLREFDQLGRSHLVIKAVLLNSVDKFKDTGDGLLLGMQKDIVQRDGRTPWGRDPDVILGTRPLDEQLGVGQLNVRRAVNQYSSGSQPFAEPGVGVLLLYGNAVTAGQVIQVADIPFLTYTPPEDEIGEALANFTFRVRDNGGTECSGVDTSVLANTITFDVVEQFGII